QCAVVTLVLFMAAAGVGNQPFECAARAANVPTQNNEPARLISAGVEALERNDLEAARGFFRQTLALKPTDVTAHTYLGVIADREGNLGEAERHFASAAAA